MCIGLPMRVVEGDDMTALCERAGGLTRLSMLLVGAQPPGAHVLAHLGAAIRVLDAEEARLIDEALLGLAEAVAGEDFSARFADLIDREPQLPEHLR
jgi:hydrogenase expression/formation protein HypC